MPPCRFSIESAWDADNARLAAPARAGRGRSSDREGEAGRGERPADGMPKVLRRVFVPAAQPEAAARTVRSLFRRHVQSAITPPLVVETVPSGVVVDLDVRIYDNYRVDEALAAVGAAFPGTRDIPVDGGA